VKANAVGFATAAASAIAAFAVKSVMAFQDLALEAGKFADATGLSSEQASRFIEVAGDIGVEAAQVEKSIGFMNKTLGNSPDLFKELGIEIERTSSGATDVNGTFLNVIDRLNRIEDPAQRAAAGTRLLGRSWMELAELVSVGSDGLSASLASVSGAKVIDAEEVQKARDLRASMDELKDRFEDLTLELGENLVPAVTQAIDQFLVLSDAIGKIPVLPDIFGNMFKGRPFHMAFIESLADMASGIFNVGEESEDTYVVTDKLKEAWIGGYRAMIDARTESDGLAASLRNQAEDVDIARLKWDEFRNGLNIEAQSLRLTGNIEDFRKKWADTTDEAKLKSREYQQELLRIQIELGNAALSIVGLATTAQNNRIRLLIETGQLERAKSLIDAIAAGMNMLAGAVTPDRVERILGQAPSGGAGTGKAPPPAAKTPQKPVGQRLEYLSPLQQLGKIRTERLARMATGGTVVGSGMALVGEQGPELVNMPRGASVIPSIPSKRMLGSGQMTVNISVQAGLVSSPDQVGAQIIEAIRRAERRSGQVFAAA
jgi:hypothetical protein